MIEIKVLVLKNMKMNAMDYFNVTIVIDVSNKLELDMKMKLII